MVENKIQLVETNFNQIFLIQGHSEFKLHFTFQLKIFIFQNIHTYYIPQEPSKPEIYEY